MKGSEVPLEVEEHVADVMANIDDTKFTEGEEDSEFGAVGKPGRFQAKLIKLAKSEFGLLKRTEANRLMVRKFLRDHMKDHGMRPSHIAEHLDVSVAIFFIPCRQDVRAHQVGASNVALTMEELILTHWETVFRPIGRLLGFSEG
uniref:Tombusvirus p33 domain-containing protein n=1 Tax=Riboviria sp. TaxID=2585031 RepID=A0A514DBY6_9VIRU|nr:MAG: hypothetical protein H4Rhizo441558_000001 [Riboviria sp.]